MTLDDLSSRLSKLAGKPVRPFSTRDFGREQYADGRSVVVDAERAVEIVEQLRGQIGPGLVAFVGCTR